MFCLWWLQAVDTAHRANVVHLDVKVGCVGERSFTMCSITHLCGDMDDAWSVNLNGRHIRQASSHFFSDTLCACQPSVACSSVDQAANLLLGKDRRIKLADFGVARSIKEGKTAATLKRPVSHCLAPDAVLCQSLVTLFPTPCTLVACSDHCLVCCNNRLERHRTWPQRLLLFTTPARASTCSRSLARWPYTPRLISGQSDACCTTSCTKGKLNPYTMQG